MSCARGRLGGGCRALRALAESQGARTRVKLLKLLWDALGSEFGSRHLQYEMFYAGEPAGDPGARIPQLRLGGR